MRHGIYRDFPLTFRDAGGHAARGDLQPARRLPRRQSGALSHRAHARLHPHLCRRQGRADPARRTHLRVRVSHRAADPLVRRQARAQLERHRQFLALPDRAATYRLQLVDGATPAALDRIYRPARRARHRLARQHRRRSARSPSRPRGGCAPGEGLTVVAALPAPRSIRPAPTRCCGTRCSTTANGSSAASVSSSSSSTISRPGNAVGRDPKRGTIIPLFHPPQGISPALANYIHNWGLTREKWRAFTAAALSLAVRGLVPFDHSGGALTLKTTGKQPAGAACRAGRRARDLHLAQWRAAASPIDKAHGDAVADVGDKFTSASRPKTATASSAAISAT